MTLGLVGRGFITLSLGVLVLSTVLWLLQGKRPSLARWAAWSFTLGGSSFFAAFAVLGILIQTHQFQYSYVFRHTDTTLEKPYLIAAMWAGQEGSFLLWALTSALFAMLAVRKLPDYRRWFSVSSAMFLAALAGILAYESPFKVEMIDNRLMPPEGSGMTPALINYWITIHPPVIFLGFGSLIVLFSLGFAALAQGDSSKWVSFARPWALVSATLLGIGLCMGGFWAYETLGWGGFWAWDPVENTSFVPWLWTVVLIHGLLLQTTRGTGRNSNLFLAGTGLLTFIYGTFLTRSGVYGDQSVHSFAEMDAGARWVLIGILGVFGLGYLGMWLKRIRSWQELQPETEPSSFLSRAGAFVSAQWLLLAMAIGAGVGMSIPALFVLQGKAPKAVEEAMYNRILVWILIPLLLGMAIGPFLSWRGSSLKVVLNRIGRSLQASLVLLAGMILWLKYGVHNEFKPAPEDSLWAPFGFTIPVTNWILFLSWLCLFTLCANMSKLLELGRRSKGGIGSMLTHVGVVVAVLGLIVSRGLQRKEQTVIQAGTPGFALGYVINLKDGDARDYSKRGNKVDFEFKSLSGERFVSSPELYYSFSGEGEPTPTVHPAIHVNGTHDIYVAVYPMQFEAGEPTTLKKGQSLQVDDTTVTYQNFRREGEAGVMGTKFFADLLVQTKGSDAVKVSPGMAITDQGPEHFRADVGGLTIALDRMDAATQDVTLQVYYQNPLFPLDVYYKPMTLLVWVGAGIMTLGGFWSAWYRRRNGAAGSGANKDVGSNIEPQDRAGEGHTSNTNAALTDS